MNLIELLMEKKAYANAKSKVPLLTFDLLILFCTKFRPMLMANHSVEAKLNISVPLDAISYASLFGKEMFRRSPGESNRQLDSPCQWDSPCQSVTSFQEINRHSKYIHSISNQDHWNSLSPISNPI